MDLVTVGTGTVAPSATRTSACHWVSRGRLKILLDCGPGALHRLAQFGLPWPEVTHVVLSHFHPDHWAEPRPGALGRRVRPAARGVLAPRGDGRREPPHTNPRGRAGPRSRRQAARLDPLLSSGRNFGPGAGGGDPVPGTRDGREGRGSVQDRRAVGC